MAGQRGNFWESLPKNSRMVERNVLEGKRIRKHEMFKPFLGEKGIPQCCRSSSAK
jgi:hypothetical protein